MSLLLRNTFGQSISAMRISSLSPFTGPATIDPAGPVPCSPVSVFSRSLRPPFRLERKVSGPLVTESAGGRCCRPSFEGMGAPESRCSSGVVLRVRPYALERPGRWEGGDVYLLSLSQRAYRQGIRVLPQMSMPSPPRIVRLTRSLPDADGPHHFSRTWEQASVMTENIPVGR
jgi:hypothetical protein